LDAALPEQRHPGAYLTVAKPHGFRPEKELLRPVFEWTEGLLKPAKMRKTNQVQLGGNDQLIRGRATGGERAFRKEEERKP